LKLGILGGTFDPVHIGHLVLAETAREQLELQKVVFIPTGQSWRKAGREIGDARHRLEMVRLAIEDNPAFEVSPVEIDRGGPSYSYETLESLTAERPGAELCFILGADALADLPNWRKPERIVELATLAVAGRTGDGGAADPERAVAGLQARLAAVEMPAIGISASSIRERVRKGLSLRYLVPQPVAEYIRRNDLYR
jgi:nicotinate-nucleotide adenylyltransferase